MHHMAETKINGHPLEHERSSHAMTATQVAILVAYAIIIAVWPLRLVVLYDHSSPAAGSRLPFHPTSISPTHLWSQ